MRISDLDLVKAGKPWVTSWTCLPDTIDPRGPKAGK
jgi:hypothetical protein